MSLFTSELSLPILFNKKYLFTEFEKKSNHKQRNIEIEDKQKNIICGSSLKRDVIKIPYRRLTVQKIQWETT